MKYVMAKMNPYGDQARDAEIANGSLTRYAKLRVTHAPGMPGTFYPPPTLKETAGYRSRHASRHVHHARAVMRAGIANPRWRVKRSRHSRRMHNPQFSLFGKRPMQVKLESCINRPSNCTFSQGGCFFMRVRINMILYSSCEANDIVYVLLDIIHVCLRHR